MKKGKKILGDDRRDFLLKVLKENDKPITGSELAKMANVSRQVIVGDITLLKAKDEPIIATNQGYLYLQEHTAKQQIEKTIACYHPPHKTEEELNIFVDNGVTVKDVRIEHPVYGDLTASIMVSNRNEVKKFIESIQRTNATYLLELTGGIHLHTVSAKNSSHIEAAEKALKKANILIDND